MAFSITTLGIKGLFVTLSIKTLFRECYDADCCYAKCRHGFMVMLDVMLSVIMLIFVILSTVMLNVVMLNVTAHFKEQEILTG